MIIIVNNKYPAFQFLNMQLKSLSKKSSVQGMSTMSRPADFRYPFSHCGYCPYNNYYLLNFISRESQQGSKKIL